MKLILLTGSKETRDEFVSLLTTHLDINAHSWAADYGRECLDQMLHARRCGNVDVGIAWLEGSTNDISDFKRHFPAMVHVCTEFSTTFDALYCIKTL